ncbi:5223_t:CDS:1 [Acaulospora colombiana]|uniref:5223_t:CDS:1 n=1 Tax=Acaulospora colombiana TaxID=27376 RepID=A0ACA9K7I6_9GLOM|nr:5223_t:CDS:1 [Acaulospora colombiana]
MEYIFVVQPSSNYVHKTSQHKKKPRETSSKNCEPKTTLDYIQMPRASEIEISEFINRSEERIGTKTPNGFFVYRRIFTREVSRLNHRLDMSNVSKMASCQWHNEDITVREEYRRVASIIGRRIKEREHELSKSFLGGFIPYIPQELHLSAGPNPHDVVEQSPYIPQEPSPSLVSEHVLSQAFEGVFVPYISQERLPFEGPSQQGVAYEELMACPISERIEEGELDLSPYISQKPFPSLVTEHELSQTFEGEFVPLISQEPFPSGCPDQQVVMDEGLSRYLYEWYSKDNIFDEFFEKLA